MLRQSFVVVCCAVIAASVAVTHQINAQPTTDLITYLGGTGNQRLLTVARLSDGTLLVGGVTDSLTWVPASTPVTPLSASGLSSAADGSIAFLARFSSDLQQVLSVHHFPQGTAANIRHIRTTEVPGQPTGAVYISGARANSSDPLLQIPGFQSGYFIARLNNNFVNGAPTGVSWIYNVNATGLYESIQPWDVRNDGGVIFARGDSNSSSGAWLNALDASGNLTIMTGWPKHILQDNQVYYGDGATYNNPSNPIQYSELNLANNSVGAWRSTTWEDFDALVPDGNGGLRKGRYAQDLYGYGPNTAGGRGYTGYRTTSSTNGIGQIAVDRRDNSIYLPVNQQTNHADGQPDFEPCFIAMTGNGSYRWSTHLYTTFQTGNGIHRSTDAAASFSNANTGLDQRNVRALHYHIGTPGLVLAGTYNGVYRSTDGGLTWNASNAGLTASRVTAFAQSPNAPTRLYAATHNGIFHSSDGGLNWTRNSTGLTDPYITCLTVSPTDANTLLAGTGGNGVFRSTDGGVTWTPSSEGLGTGGNLWVNAIVFDPSDATQVYLGTGGGDGLLKSPDGGLHWAPSNASTASSGWRDYVFALAIHRPSTANPAILYAGTNSGIFKSTDGGGNWTVAFPSGSLIIQPRAIAIHPSNPNVVLAGTTYRGLFKTTDGGATWTRNNTGLPSYAQTVTSLAAMVYAVALDPANPNTVLVGILGGPWASIPDQYGDSAAVNYSVPLESGGEVAVIARSHGSDVRNLWRGDSIPPSQNPANPGFSYHNDFTGSNGNIHTSWAGRLRISDGVLLYASRIAEFPYTSSLNIGSAYTDPNLDGWPDKNSGYPDLNTTTTRQTTPAFDSKGRFIVTAEGRLTHTTRNAWQKNPNRYRRGNLTAVTNATVVAADSLFGNEQITPGAATFMITSSGTNKNVTRTITAFDPVSGQITLDSPLPALPAVGNAFLINEGASNWSWFVRTHSPDFSTLTYSSLLTGQFDRSVMTSATGGDNTVFGQAIPLDDGVIVVGYHTATNGVADGNPIPTRLVPPWGTSTPTAEEGFIARLAYNPPPTVFVRATTPETVESGGSPGVFTFTRTGDITGNLTVEYLLGGSALNGVHFATLNGSVTFPAGQRDVALNITPIDNSTLNPDRTVLLTLRDDRVAFRPGILSNATVLIRDNDAAGTVSLTANSASLAETDGNLTVTARRDHGNAGTITVQFATANDTASAGADYLTAGGTLSWPNGDNSPRTFTVTVLPDSLSEGTETFHVTLSNATGGAVIGTPSLQTVSIADRHQPGTVQFRAASFSEMHERGFAHVLVERTGGSSGPASATVRTLDQSALGGTHYVPTALTVTWADGETGTRAVAIPFLESGAPSDVTLLAVLSDVTGASLGNPDAVPVTIRNQTPSGTVRFALRAVAVDRTSGNASLEVVRLAGADGAVTVDYATADGTALAGTHYTATSGTLSWADGESGPRTISIPILGTPTSGNTVQFSVALGNLTGAATLGAPSTANVAVTDATGATTLTWNNTSGDWQWNTTSVNWIGNATVYANGMSPSFGATGQTGSGNVITVAAGGVSPARTTFNATGSTSVAFQLAGGNLLTGSVIKNGSDTVTLGTSTQPYAGSQPFPGGTTITGTNGTGTLEYRVNANITTTDIEFGTGPITLQNFGGFRFIGNTGLLNDFIVAASGGNISYKAASNGFPVTFKGNLQARGDVNFTGTAGGNLGGYGHRYDGDILVTGNRLFTRAVNHGNANFTFTGNLHDGDTPGTVRLANRIDRIWYIAGTDNTYTGGTVIESNNKTWVTSNLGNSSYYDDYRAVVVEPSSRLGTGPVTVRTGGLLVLRSATNLHPDTTLSLEAGCALVVETGVSVPVGSLVINGVAQPPGSYNASTTPNHIYGEGEIIVIPPRITIETTEPEAFVGGPNATFTVTRFGGIQSPLTVFYTVSGTGIAGSDYAPLPGSIVIPANQTTASINLVALTTPTGGRNVTLTLTANTAYTVTEPGTATAWIADPASPGALSLTPGTVTADETQGTLTLHIERVGGAAGPAQVTVSTTPGTASAGTDYASAVTTLTWADSETGSKPFTVNLIDDFFEEGTKTFQVALSNATGAAIGTPATATITLIDNDGIHLTWNQTGTTNRTWDETQPNWSGLLPSWRNGTHTLFTDTGAGNITIQSAGVRPASVIFNGSSAVYTFLGGILQQGSVLVTGQNTIDFGSSTAPYLTNHTFEGDTVIRDGGTLGFTSNIASSPVWFGSGNITLDNGTLYFSGSGDTADTAVNGLLANPIRVLSGGGVLRFSQIAKNRAGGANTTIHLYGDLSFQGTAGGNGPSGTGYRLAGTIVLHGARTITRENKHNNAASAILSTIVDGETPGHLTISNQLDRPFHLAANSTYSGGTTFAPTVAFDPSGDSLFWSRKKYAVYVRDGARLGTGDITVRSGAFAWFGGNGNIHPRASLTIESGSTVVVDSNRTLTVRLLNLGGNIHTTGTFNSSNSPSYLSSGNQTDGGGNITVVYVPEPPVNLEAYGITPSRIDLSWTQTAIVPASIEIERREEPAGLWTPVATLPASPIPTSYSDTGLSANTSYTYRVRALNENGASSWSKEFTAATLAINAPAAPTGLTAAAIDVDQIQLLWDDNASNESGYRIERRSGAGAWTQLAEIGPDYEGYLDTGLASGVQYSYRVHAYNAGGPSALSNTASASPPFQLTRYQVWLKEFFGPAEQGDPAVAAPDANPDADDLTNLEEYALGGNPDQPEPSSDFFRITIGPDSHPRIEYRERIGDPTLSYTIGTGSDLATWDLSESELQETGITPHPDGITEWITLRYDHPVSNDRRRFFRLQIDDGL